MGMNAINLFGFVCPEQVDIFHKLSCTFKLEKQQFNEEEVF